MRRQVAYLRRHGAAGKIPTTSIRKDTQLHQIRVNEITAAIRAVVRADGTAIGLTEADISALSLHGRCHGLTHGVGGTRHHPPGGGVAEQHDAPLPAHDGQELH